MGIKEYWMVSPEYRTVDVSVLDETGRYRATCHKDTVKYNDFEIDLTKVFPPLPPEDEELCQSE
jgi:Uma2 family endonuclease